MIKGHDQAWKKIIIQKKKMYSPQFSSFFFGGQWFQNGLSIYCNPMTTPCNHILLVLLSSKQLEPNCNLPQLKTKFHGQLHFFFGSNLFSSNCTCLNVSCLFFDSTILLLLLGLEHMNYNSSAPIVATPYSSSPTSYYSTSGEKKQLSNKRQLKRT